MISPFCHFTQIWSNSDSRPSSINIQNIWPSLSVCLSVCLSIQYIIYKYRGCIVRCPYTLSYHLGAAVHFCTWNTGIQICTEVPSRIFYCFFFNIWLTLCTLALSWDLHSINWVLRYKKQNCPQHLDAIPDSTCKYLLKRHLNKLCPSLSFYSAL